MMSRSRSDSGSSAGEPFGTDELCAEIGLDVAGAARYEPDRSHELPVG